MKVLFFFKAGSGPGQKDELEKALQKDLLGVTTTRFSRKLYHITGDYDFMVPFDCENISMLNEAINDFAEKHGNLITTFTNTVCHPSGEQGSRPLDALDVPFIESLLINATNMLQFEERVKNEDIFSSILEKGEFILEEEGISPREDYVRDKIKKEDKNAISEYLKKFISFENIGVESTIEFKDGELIQVLSRFYFKDYKSKRSFLERIRNKIRRHEIMAIIYEPVRSPLTLLCILMVKELVELEVIFDDLRKDGTKTEFHVIFHQKYYSKMLEKNICKPCFHPIECPTAIVENCGQCVRYILRRKRNSILNIDFEENIKRKVNISLVGVDMTFSQFLALEELLDIEKIRDEIFNNYREFTTKIEGKAKNLYESYEDVMKNFRGIRDKDEYRNSYKEAIINILDHVLASKPKPDIIVFPEYSIPSYTYNEIRRHPIKNECIIVAGSYISHINDDRFNVCPIIFNNKDGEKKIFQYYKNNFNPFEEDLGLIKNKGTAYLKFLNTAVGNLYVQLCFDIHRVIEFKEAKNVDFLLVPSFNLSSQFVDNLKTEANNKLVVAYANTKNDGDVKSSFFVPPKEALMVSKKGVESFHTDRWRTEKGKAKKKIFEFKPYSTEFKKKEINEFNFNLKHMEVDVIELDRRRGIENGQQITQILSTQAILSA